MKFRGMATVFVILGSTFSVLAVPTASFSTSGDLCQNSPIDFIDNSSTTVGTIVLWAWDFGDGQSSNVVNPTYTYTRAGVFLVRLTVIDSNGEVDEFTTTITIGAGAIVDFSNTTADNCLSTTQTFVSSLNLPPTSITSYEWDYGDGNVSFNANGSNTFTTPNTYSVTLTVSTTSGCSSFLTKEIDIFTEPTAGFSVANQCLDREISFINTSNIVNGNLTYLWNFGDGSFSTLINPDHRYANPGDYTVILTATSIDGGCSESHSQMVTVFENPEATFVAASQCMGNDVSFTNNSRGINLTFEWDFGDGNTSTAFEPTHQYNLTGSFIVGLTVTSGDNCTDSFSQRVDFLSNPLPIFFVDDNCHQEPTVFNNLTDESMGALSYEWDFGDGSVASSDRNPSHIYRVPGIYTVSLKVSDVNSCETTIPNDVEIFEIPQADFEAAPVCDGTLTSFVNQSAGSISSYFWDFGDLTNASNSDPDKQYLNPGIYDVTLMVESTDGCTHAITKQVTVNELPVANFTGSDVCFGDPIFFDNTSVDNSATTTYSWNFGDGNTSVAKNPAHTYSTSGVYTVTLTVFSSAGCKSTFTDQVIVYGLPQISAGEDVSISRGASVELMAQGGFQYVWSPADGLNDSNIPNPIARPLETTEYVVLVTDQVKCQNRDTVTVTILEDFRIVPANIITADGNGQNDRWVIPNADAFDRIQVKVYNRNGVLVFEDDNYQNDWEGTKGKDILPDGTYYYLITFPNTSIQYNGAITLLRNR